MYTYINGFMRWVDDPGKQTLDVPVTYQNGQRMTPQTSYGAVDANGRVGQKVEWQPTRQPESLSLATRENFRKPAGVGAIKWATSTPAGPTPGQLDPRSAPQVYDPASGTMINDPNYSKPGKPTWTTTSTWGSVSPYNVPLPLKPATVAPAQGWTPGKAWVFDPTAGVNVPRGYVPPVSTTSQATATGGGYGYTPYDGGGGGGGGGYSAPLPKWYLDLLRWNI